MMHKALFKSLPIALALLIPACVVETEPVEDTGQAYEYLEGDETRARCVDRPMRRDTDDRLSCRTVEVRRADADGRCDCDVAGRRVLERAERDRVARDVERDHRTRGRDLTCACEVRQLERDAARACEETRGDDVRDDRGDRIHGWCGERVARGVDDALDRCDGHGVRLVGEARVRDGAELMIRCD